MKLLTRTSVYIVTFSLVVFFLTGVAIYKVLRTMSEKLECRSRPLCSCRRS